MSDFIIPDKMPEFAKEHIKRYIDTNGADGHFWDATDAGGSAKTPTLLLFTIGRNSGRKMVIPLVYGKRDNCYVVVGSKAGAPHNPFWYLNLKANPEIEIQVADQRFVARARDAEGDERLQLWNMMVEIYPPYADYQGKTDRQIPIVVFEPV